MPTYHVSSVGAALPSPDRTPKVFNARRAAQMRERAEMAARVSASVKRPESARLPLPPASVEESTTRAPASDSGPKIEKENHEWSLASATTSGPSRPPTTPGGGGGGGPAAVVFGGGELKKDPGGESKRRDGEGGKSKKEEKPPLPEVKSQSMAPPTFALTEAQKKQLESSLPMDSKGVPITDFFDKRIATAYRCPHAACENIIFVQTNDFNCRIFRCGVYKATGQPINPHANKADCDNLARTGAIHGCGRPLRITQDDHAIICDYI